MHRSGFSSPMTIFGLLKALACESDSSYFEEYHTEETKDVLKAFW